MPITKKQAQMAQETVEMLQKHGAKIDKPVRVSPVRMAAIQAASRMRMTVGIAQGVSVQIVEDIQAPEFEKAIAEATESPSTNKVVLASERSSRRKH